MVYGLSRWETAYKRFAEQCVLSHDEIMEAIENTNVFLNVEEYDCPIFNHDVKMPNLLYPDKTQDEKDRIYEDLVWEKWNEYNQNKHITPIIFYSTMRLLKRASGAVED